MSSDELEIAEKNKFIERFIEACGSDEPAEIKRLLNVSYPAARNYLDGRIPRGRILLKIAANTDYSLHWLLTGIGEKVVPREPSIRDTPIPPAVTLESVREICVQVVSAELDRRLSAEPKIFVLPTDQVKSEKAMEISDAFSDKQT
jgi:hypothetical protein